MKTLIKRDFVSWKQPYSDKRAVALCELPSCEFPAKYIGEGLGWFQEAINCFRDGDMGDEGEDGVYSRIWAGDNLNIYGKEECDYRYATEDEVDKYLAHCSLDWYEGEEVYAIVRGKESYVLYEKK